MKNILILTALLSATICFSQPNIDWQNTIGANGTDRLNSIRQTTDGGYILGGYSYSNISGDKTESSQGLSDYWVVKTDAYGAIQWQNTIGGADQDYLFSVEQTNDGGYILGGYSNSQISGDKTGSCKGGFDYWVLKLNADGIIQWQKTIGGSLNDRLYSVQQTSDGGYVLGGESQSNISGDKTENSHGGYDYWVVKLDASGTIQWQNTIGGLLAEYLRSIQQTDDEGYVLGGESQSNISGDKTENSQGGYDYWVVKIDANGAIQWQNTIGGNINDQLRSILQSNDGGYMLGGSSRSNASGDKSENSQGGNDYWVVKINDVGAIQWQNTIGGSSNDQLYSISQTNDGGYIMSGESQSDISGDKTENSHGVDDYWVVKIDDIGVIQWQSAIGGSSAEIANSVQQTNDGGYILGGYSRSNISGDKTEISQGSDDYWVVKFCGVILTDTVEENICFGDSALIFGIYQTTAGVYCDSLVTASGCDSVCYTKLVVNTVDISVTLAGITLTANAIGATYQWVDCDNAFDTVSGETSQEFTPLANGNYAVVVTQNGCTDTSSCYSVTGVGINHSLISNNQFIIYPNPTTGVFKLKGEIMKGLENVQIFDLFGRAVPFSINNQTFDISHLQKGNYIVRIEGTVKKLVLH